MKDRFKVIVAVTAGLGLGLGIIFAERQPPGGQTVVSGKIDSPVADSNANAHPAPAQPRRRVLHWHNLNYRKSLQSIVST